MRRDRLRLLAGLLLACASCAVLHAGDANPNLNPAAHVHTGDYRTCKVCNKALEKSFGYIKANLNGQVLKNVWYAEFLGAFYAGFAFLMEGNSEKEARQCAEHICKYFDWVKRHGGYEGWFCSMAMMYLTEYSLRYGATPEIAAHLEWGAKWCHKTREAEGGWFHNPRWGQGNYAFDISSVGCGYFMAIEEMKVLGIPTGPALEDVRDYANRICDGKSVAYGLPGRGGFSLAASSYLLIGLTSTGQNADPRVAGIGEFLKQNYKDIRKAHASGMLHHFAVAAAMHRLGPEAYTPFAQYYLHERLIPNQREDGGIGTFPNDNAGDSIAAYAEMKEKTDFVSTAIMAAMILLERPGAFSPRPVKRQNAISNKDAFKIASDALAKGELGKAYKNFAEVLPLGDSEELVPKAQEQAAKIETAARAKLKEIQDKETQDIPVGKAKADARDYAAAVVAYEGILKGYTELQKQYSGVPCVDETRTRVDELKAIVQPLRVNLAMSGGRVPPAAATTGTAATVPATTAAGTATGKLKDADGLKKWEEKLRTRVSAALASGAKLRLDSKALRQRMTMTSMSESGDFAAALEQGGQMSLKWSMLKLDDWQNIAMNLAQSQNTPADHALSAFFLLYQNESDKASGYLEKAGAEAAAVREAFVVQ